MKCKTCGIEVDANGVCPACQKVIGKEPKKKRILFPIIIAVVAVVVVLLGAGAWLYVKNIPKLKFEVLIDKTLDYAIGNFKNSNFNTAIIDYTIQTDMSSQGEESVIFDMLNKLEISGNVEVDYKNNFSNIKLNATYDKEELVTSEINSDGTKLYVYLKNLFNKYIAYDLEALETNSTKNEATMDDYIKLSEKSQSFLKKALKREYFEISKEDGITKSTLKLDGKNSTLINLSLLESFKYDEEALDCLSRVMNIDKDKIKVTIEEEIENANGELVRSDYEDIGEISIYTKSFSQELVKVEIKSEEDCIVFEWENEEELVLKASPSEGENFTIKIKNVKNGNNNSLNVKIISDEINIGFKLDYSVKYNVEVKKTVIKDSIDFEQLSENDSNLMIEKFQQSKGFKKLSEDLMALYSMMGLGIGFEA